MKKSLTKEIDNIKKLTVSGFYKQFQIKILMKKSICQKVLEYFIQTNEISTQQDLLNDQKDQECLKIQQKYPTLNKSFSLDQNLSTNIDESIPNYFKEDKSRFQDQGSYLSYNSLKTKSVQSQNLNCKSQRTFNQKGDEYKKVYFEKHRSQEQRSEGEKVQQKNIDQRYQCDRCVSTMRQLSSMQLLKNQYYKSFLLLKIQRQQLNKSQEKVLQCQKDYASLNELRELYNYDSGSSQKSSFSFENMQKDLLAERFIIQSQQISVLIEKLLLVEVTSLEVFPEVCRNFEQFYKKTKILKKHIDLNLKDDHLDLHQLQIKHQRKVRILHQKYKKLIQKMNKAFKQKQNKTHIDFQQVNL